MEVGWSSRNTLEHAMLFNLFFFHIRYFFLLFLFALWVLKKKKKISHFFKWWPEWKYKTPPVANTKNIIREEIDHHTIPSDHRPFGHLDLIYTRIFYLEILGSIVMKVQ